MWNLPNRIIRLIIRIVTRDRYCACVYVVTKTHLHPPATSSCCEGVSASSLLRWGEHFTVFLICTHPITHTLYSLIKRQTHFSIVFIDRSDTCASFLASSSWNTHLVQHQRAWGEYVEFIQTLSECVFVCVIVSSSQKSKCKICEGN